MIRGLVGIGHNPAMRRLVKIMKFSTEYAQVERALKELRWSLGKRGAEVAQRIKELQVERDDIIKKYLMRADK